MHHSTVDERNRASGDGHLACVSSSSISAALNPTMSHAVHSWKKRKKHQTNGCRCLCRAALTGGPRRTWLGFGASEGGTLKTSMESLNAATSKQCPYPHPHSPTMSILSKDLYQVK